MSRKIKDIPTSPLLENVPCKPISYEDCANALLMLWMENILTDGEYSKIMGKLNAKKDAFSKAT